MHFHHISSMTSSSCNSIEVIVPSISLIVFQCLIGRLRLNRTHPPTRQQTTAGSVCFPATRTSPASRSARWPPLILSVAVVAFRCTYARTCNACDRRSPELLSISIRGDRPHPIGAREARYPSTHPHSHSPGWVSCWSVWVDY